MAAPSLVLFALHNGIEPRGFEILCTDLLVREGYSQIIPGGKTRDHGRDAEVRFWVDADKGFPQTAFQFSMEKKWEAKLRRDIEKIRRQCDRIERIVFVTSRSITFEKQDKLRQEFRETEGVILEVLDEGWFRVRLEEEHVDLAQKHLGVTVAPTPSFYAAQVKMRGLTDENQAEILRHTTPEALRATLRAQVIKNAKDAGAWKGIAHVDYFLHDYEDALLAASKALKLSQDHCERWNLVALKASIIAEQGIKTGSRLLLRKAQALFAPFIEKLGRAIDHYNLANILGALKECEMAEVHYRRSLSLDPNFAQAWKNLGSLLCELKRQNEGMDCLDQSLRLNPNLLEAICTKANVLVITSNNCVEALSLMERAFAIDPDVERRWPHAHYWYAIALCRENRLQEALTIVEDRLERRFDCPYLGRLASDILAQLWRSDSNYLQKAEAFFALRMDSQERDYRALAQFMDILVSTDRESEAWSTFGRFLNVKEIPIETLATRIGISVGDLTDSFASVEYYRAFRKSSPLVDYAKIFDRYNLEPHGEVPEILFHLFLVSYFRVAAVWQESDAKTSFEREAETLRKNYEFIVRALAGFWGWLLAPLPPDGRDNQASLISAGIVAGLDIPLIEISRLIGYLAGVADRPLPECHTDAVVGMTAGIQEIWISEFLRAVGSDWKIETLQDRVRDVGQS